MGGQTASGGLRAGLHAFSLSLSLFSLRAFARSLWLRAFSSPASGSAAGICYVDALPAINIVTVLFIAGYFALIILQMDGSSNPPIPILVSLFSWLLGFQGRHLSGIRVRPWAADGGLAPSTL